MNPRRKLLIALGASALAAPLRGFAQQPARIPRIGILASSESGGLLPGFYRGLRKLGYVEGKNILIERRFTGNDTGKALPLARELVALKVDVIVAPSSTFVEAARQATTVIPIVFTAHNDPVGNGHIVSLARPGGNITGVSQMATELNAKQLELVKEMLPRAHRIAVLSNPTTPSHVPALMEIEQAGRKLGLKLHMIEASSLAEFELAFEAVAKTGDQALLLLTSPLSMSEHKQIAELALKRRLPVMFGQGVYADAGGLISYGPNLHEISSHAAIYVDKILKGSKPGDLPVEQPTIFELVINMKTAKALGIKIPQSLLARADKVIE